MDTFFGKNPIDICPICKVKGDLMGYDESLYECSKNPIHIWSYHIEECVWLSNCTCEECCKSYSYGVNCKFIQESIFLGWINNTYNLHKNDPKTNKDEEFYNNFGEDYTNIDNDEDFVNHPNFKVIYDSDKLEDGSMFMWRCSGCGKTYTNMYCG